MSAKKTRAKRPGAHKLDEAAGKKAFEALRSRLDDLAREELIPIRLDVQHAAAVAHSVALRDAAENRRARLDTLASSGAFDIDEFDLLPDIARATWYVRQQQKRQLALTSEATVPLATIRDAQAVRARMLRVLEHYFDDDAEYGPRLAAIRAGAGFQDLANDLEELAELYTEQPVRALAAKDPKHWQESDIQMARTLAEVIFRGLGLSSQGDAARWADLTQRAWTLLSATYDEVRAVGRFVFRRDEDTDITYPSLVVATRTAVSRSPTTDEEPPLPEPAVDSTVDSVAE